MAAVDQALIHRARVRGQRRGEPAVRNAQGEFVRPESDGAWFPCRRMTMRQRAEGDDAPGSRRRTERRYQLMWGEEHEDGSPIVAPRASDRVEVEVQHDEDPAPVSEVWEVSDEPLAFDTGEYVFGGQAEIVRVSESA